MSFVGGKWKIPDWRETKIDGIKELEYRKNYLAKKGLKDPWARNDVWRYNGYTTPVRMVGRIFTRGMPFAAVLMVATVAADQALGISAANEHHELTSADH